jgi:hypothetical protein
MELNELIAASLSNIEKEREEKRFDVTKYNVRYRPCGHTRAIRLNETELIILATKSKGSVVLSSDECPFCPQ